MGFYRNNSHCHRNICRHVNVNAASTSDFKIHSSPLQDNKILAKVGQSKVKCLVDSGASVSCISRSFVESAFPKGQLESSNVKCVRGVCGEQHQVLGQIELPVKIDGLIIYQNFLVFQRLHSSVILGLDFLHDHIA